MLETTERLTMNFTIEKNIPLNSGSDVRMTTRGMTAIIRKLEIGDSFAAPISWQKDISRVGSRLGLVLATRKLPATESNGILSIRVWRVA